MRDLLLVTIVAAFCLLALRRPATGYLAFVTLGFLNPHSLAWGVGRSLRLSAMLAVCTFVGYALWREPKRFPRQTELWLILGLWILFGITTYSAIYPDRAFHRFTEVSKVLVMAMFGAAVIRDDGRIQLLLRVIALSIGFHAIKATLFVVATGGQQIVYGPDDSFLAANNSIALALVMNLPILVYLSRHESRRWLLWLIRAMIVASYPAIIFAYSRGAWLGLAFVTLMMVFRIRHRAILFAGASLVAVLCVPFVIGMAPDRLVNRYGSLVNYEEDTSAESRFWNWELCGRVGLGRPITGGGFDFYSTAVNAKYYPEYVQRWGDKVWSCHSVWFTILGEHGLPGLALWVVLLTSCLRSVRRIRRLGRAEQADMLRNSLIAFMIVGTFMDAAYFDMLYYLILVLILIKERTEQMRADEPARRPSAPSPLGARPAGTDRRPAAQSEG